MTNQDQLLLQLAIDKKALTHGDFTLSSGKKSPYYFDGRKLSMDPQGAHLIAHIMLPLLNDAGADAVGGPVLGAVPIAAAIALASQSGHRPIQAFAVRNEQKAHGTQSAIEGNIWPGAKAAIVDDVCTTGTSLLHAIHQAEDAGAHVVAVITVLDRQEGGSAEIRRRGYSFHSILSANLQGSISPTASTWKATMTKPNGRNMLLFHLNADFEAEPVEDGMDHEAERPGPARHTQMACRTHPHTGPRTGRKPGQRHPHMAHGVLHRRLQAILRILSPALPERHEPARHTQMACRTRPTGTGFQRH